MCIQLYELPMLFIQLLSAAPTDVSPSICTESIAEAHLKRDVFLYTPGVSCE